MTAIGTDSQVRLNLEHLVGSFPTYANDPPVLLDEISNLGLHLQVKRRIELPDKLLFAIGLALPGRALLETIGRKTGKPRRTPVGDGLVGNQFWIVAEHGMRADYVRNLAKNPRVRLKLRHGILARWHSGTAHVLPHDDPRERQRWLAQQLPASRTNATFVRLLGTELLTVRIDLDASGDLPRQ